MSQLQPPAEIVAARRRAGCAVGRGRLRRRAAT